MVVKKEPTPLSEHCQSGCKQEERRLHKKGRTGLLLQKFYLYKITVTRTNFWGSQKDKENPISGLGLLVFGPGRGESEE